MVSKSLYGHKVNQLGRLLTKRLNEKLTPSGLHSSQWLIILLLHDRKECTQVELGHYLNVEAPTITRTLTRLEEMGWITRFEGKDKREKHIRLTNKVDAEFQKWFEAAVNVEKDALRHIDEHDLNVFNRVLDKMTKNLGDTK
ncbi:MarR family winged helix-turn-helix transcriptional regulator [Heliophilum fasciatum]|uniref:MarR family transcriptional regulator n=1 Tax=Heliophilum fasciatum TaxID=35700 RepID=A0A4R2S8L9_9FIRM|nr:MarR family transcriptional regulator [Heliophilum fasciatum]MCW2276778.1 DNA-binding MarR family transcriptional regulator [Heliophilum fasciatum]TCP68761.1 MarR family transcriptional regulator [Heliophilum fasciatum]